MIIVIDHYSFYTEDGKLIKNSFVQFIREPGTYTAFPNWYRMKTITAKRAQAIQKRILSLGFTHISSTMYDTGFSMEYTNDSHDNAIDWS